MSYYSSLKSEVTLFKSQVPFSGKMAEVKTFERSASAYSGRGMDEVWTVSLIQS